MIAIVYLFVRRNPVSSLVNGQSQTDPSFKSNRLYTRLTAKQVREQLIIQFGYTDQELPTSTLSVKLNQLGYRLRRVAKELPNKKRSNYKLN